MLKSLLSAITFLIMLSPSLYAQDFIVYLGDIDGSAGAPIEVGINDIIDVPMYWMVTDSAVNIGNVLLPLAINDRYADYFDTANCYIEPDSRLFSWEISYFDGLFVNQEGYYPYDTYPDPVWHSYSLVASWAGPPPVTTHPFTSLVPELEAHFKVHINGNLFNINDSTCWLLAEGTYYNSSLPGASDSTGPVVWDVQYDCACYSFAGGAGLAGTVTNDQGDTLSGAIVSIESLQLVDTTNSLGQYSFADINGNFEVKFSYPGYLDLT